MLMTSHHSVLYGYETCCMAAYVIVCMHGNSLNSCNSHVQQRNRLRYILCIFYERRIFKLLNSITLILIVFLNYCFCIPNDEVVYFLLNRVQLARPESKVYQDRLAWRARWARKVTKACRDFKAIQDQREKW